MAVLGGYLARCFVTILGLSLLVIAAGCDGDPGAPSPTASPSPGPTLSPTAMPTPSQTPTPRITTPSPTPTATPVPDTVSFTPAVPTLDNPITPDARPDAGFDASASHSVLTIKVVAYDAAGMPLEPSESNPLYIQVYGAPPGVLTPTNPVLTSGDTVTFDYSGDYFLNNMTVEAWIYDPLAGIPAGEPGAVQGGYAIGVTQIAHQHRPVCNYGSQNFTLTALSGHVPPAQFVVNEAVGYGDPSKATFSGYTVDTGSLGLLTPLSELPTPQPTPTAGGPVIGPGPFGQQYYDSSGNAFSGYYYLAPVTFQTDRGTV